VIGGRGHEPGDVSGKRSIRKRRNDIGATLCNAHNGENAWTTHDVSDDALGADTANMQAVATLLVRYLDELAPLRETTNSWGASSATESRSASTASGGSCGWRTTVGPPSWSTSAPAVPCASVARRGSVMRRRTSLRPRRDAARHRHPRAHHRARRPGPARHARGLHGRRGVAARWFLTRRPVAGCPRRSWPRPVAHTSSASNMRRHRVADALRRVGTITWRCSRPPGERTSASLGPNLPGPPTSGWADSAEMPGLLWI
jgi:hypothetical protein